MKKGRQTRPYPHSILYATTDIPWRTPRIIDPVASLRSFWHGSASDTVRNNRDKKSKTMLVGRGGRRVLKRFSPRVSKNLSRTSPPISTVLSSSPNLHPYTPIEGCVSGFFLAPRRHDDFAGGRAVSGGLSRAGNRPAKKQGAKPLKLGPLPVLAPEEGFEPPTQRLTAACSTTELLRISIGGADRIRTGVHGFAGRCVATPPPRRANTLSARSERAAALRATELRRCIGAGQGTSRHAKKEVSLCSARRPVI